MADTEYTREQVQALRKALEQIAKPGYGLELNDSIEEREHYWQTTLLRCRETARSALAALPSASLGEQREADNRLAAFLTKLPTLDPTWPEAVQDGWMRCFNALRALAASPEIATACACGDVERQGWVHRPDYCWPYDEAASPASKGAGGGGAPPPASIVADLPGMAREAARLAIAQRVCLEVAELPDRTSPEDWPQAMLVTHDELLAIVLDALPLGASQEPSDEDIARAFADEQMRPGSGHYNRNDWFRAGAVWARNAGVAVDASPKLKHDAPLCADCTTEHACRNRLDVPRPCGVMGKDKPCPHCDAPPGHWHSFSCPVREQPAPGVKGPEHG